MVFTKTIVASSVATFGHAMRIEHERQGSSPFETFVAESPEQHCPGEVHRSTCSNDDFKGIVLFFHGYSACAEQVGALAPTLTASCFDVVAPTMPGHGRNFVWCSSENTDCDISVSWYGDNGWEHKDLPTHGSDYREFAEQVHEVVVAERAWRAQETGKPESDVELSLSGLSFGAPMALYLAMHSQNMYARQMLINPYYALGDETIDQDLLECQVAAQNGEGNEEECDRDVIVRWLTGTGVEPDNIAVRWLLGDDADEVTKHLFNNLVMMSDTFGEDPSDHEDESTSIGAIMEEEQFWGGVCDDSFQRGRKGFCAFKKKHLLATHSFSLHTVAQAQHRGAWRRGVPYTQTTITERDGHTRNGYAFAVAQHLESIAANDISMCIHRFTRGTDRSDDAAYWSNENSMPHANLLPHNPGGWWEPKLLAQVQDFFTGARNSVSDSADWDGSREQCVDLPLTGDFDHELVEPSVAPTHDSELEAGFLWRSLKYWR